MAKTAKIDKSLSDDAKCILGGMLGLGIPGETTVTFQMVENRPTARTQAAFDELVEAGYLTVEPFNRFGGVVYTLQKESRPYFQWMMRNQSKGKFPITEPIEEKADG